METTRIKSILAWTAALVSLCIFLGSHHLPLIYKAIYIGVPLLYLAYRYLPPKLTATDSPFAMRNGTCVMMLVLTLVWSFDPYGALIKLVLALYAIWLLLHAFFRGGAFLLIAATCTLILLSSL
jgi:hypothetical protein